MTAHSKFLFMASILASIIGGVLSVVIFRVHNPSGFLESIVLPGTMAFLVVSGGHAGAPAWAEAIAPFVAVVVNMLTYAFIVFGAIKILCKMKRENSS